MPSGLGPAADVGVADDGRATAVLHAVAGLANVVIGKDVVVSGQRLVTKPLPVILLVGGLGTRMAGGDERPKALVEIGERPIVWHIMKLNAHYGHTHFVFPLGYRGEAFQRYFAAGGTEASWTLAAFDAGLHANKGARIRRAAARIADGRFLATYGDGIGDVDLDALVRFHDAHGRLATVTAYQPCSQYGMLELDGDRVVALHEKPRLSTWVNAGFFVFDRGALAYMQGAVEDDETVDLERDVLPGLARDGQLMVYRHRGFWASMDTFKDAQMLNDVWAQGAPWKVWR